MKELASQQAKLEWDENGQPISTVFDDIYFSKASGIGEAQYVFIENNRLPSRWKKNVPEQTFTIAETGFGTGLNFLATWDCWKKQPSSHQPRLHFISVEKYPLSPIDLRKALSLFDELSPLAEQLIRYYPAQPLDGTHRMVFEQGKIILTLYFGDATDGFQTLANLNHANEKFPNTSTNLGGVSPNVDAWFLDGFAPSKNPEMWHEQLFSAIANLSQPGTTFSTFTAASIVRKGLTEVGFSCKKVKGYGRKREQLTGEFCSPQNQETPLKASTWYLTHSVSKKPKEAVVIGGGLAGCHTANALARKGIKVTLLEKNTNIASEASGNKQGAVYTKLSPHPNPLCVFNLNAQVFANHFYETFNLFSKCGGQSGVFHVSTSEKEENLYQALAKRFFDSEDFLKWVPQSQTKTMLNLELNSGGLLVPKAGWLAPAQLCQQLIQHPSIETHTGMDVGHLVYKNNNWELYNKQRELICHAKNVVIATAFHAQKFDQTAHLPLKRIRGQVSHISSTEITEQLQHTICGEGYISPAQNNQHCIGATFTLHDDSESLTELEHQENVQKITSMIPQLAESMANSPVIGGKVGFRCTTPDYFPVVGPVADIEKMKEDFSLLRKNANRIIDKPGTYLPGLYCNLGHGSKGLAYTPLTSELLASIVCGEHLPIDRDLYLHLHPGRFIIKDLKRNKI